MYLFIMKYLIYGYNGWIGSQLINLLDSLNFNYVKGISRLENKEELEEEIKKIVPTHVISFTGRTHGSIGDKHYTTIDYLEQKGKIYENVRDNLFGPIVLANLSKKYNFHLTYLGTGCIFEFDSNHPFGEEINGFTENSKPNFFGSGYSVVKGFTDELMHMYDDSVLNIRIRMPITSDKSNRNFINKILNYKKICSVPNSMTVLPELLPLVLDMTNKKLTGTINLSNPGLISHNEILEMYREIINNDFKWENFSIEEQTEILDAGRSNNYLDTTRLETLYPNVKNIKDSVREILFKMKEN
jgi:dTDP-4-dehydrorhamnose reductase